MTGQYGWTVRLNESIVHVVPARIMQRLEQCELLSRQVFLIKGTGHIF